VGYSLFYWGKEEGFFVTIISKLKESNINFRCKYCATKPELKGTGYSEPHPAYFCPVCKHPYWWLVTYDINVQGIIKGRSAKLHTNPKKGSFEEWMKKHGDSYWWR
jgi:hypothetical protein